MYLLDKATVQEVLNSNLTVRGHLTAAVSSGAKVGISAITETQVRTMLTRHQPAALGLFDQLLQRAPSLAWDSRCAQVYAAIDAKLTPGHHIAPLDLWAAVHAVSIGATFVSNNQGIRVVPGILVKDWAV